MTHAESQDLLLDLAFGELDAPRAAEVEEHLAGCAACREEKAALDEARRLSAPLRAAEEPPPGFDDRILQAARAEAHHQHDGNVGKVIEVTGNVRPLGVEAARIDAHAKVSARPAAGRRPKWMVRAALGGSVAAAAALALVVSTTLDARRTADRARQAQGEEYKIRVKPAAPEAVDSALRGAAPDHELDRRAVNLAKETVTPNASPPAALDERKDGAAPVAQGSLPGAAEKQDRAASAQPPKRKAAAERPRQEATQSVASDRDALAGGASSTVPISSGDRAAAPARSADSTPRAAAGAGARGEIAAAAKEKPAVQPKEEAGMKSAAAAAAEEKAAVQAKEESRMNSVAAAAAIGPAELEANAQQARHSGNYVLAASLYRQAADLRRRSDDPPSAAWNLAHAVECLSAAARFDEARQVRDELSRLYPAQTTALSAAHRALREVDAPQSLPASKQK